MLHNKCHSFPHPSYHPLLHGCGRRLDHQRLMDLARKFEIGLCSEQEEVGESQVSCLTARAKLASKEDQVSSALCSAQVRVV